MPSMASVASTRAASPGASRGARLASKMAPLSSGCQPCPLGGRSQCAFAVEVARPAIQQRLHHAGAGRTTHGAGHALEHHCLLASRWYRQATVKTGCLTCRRHPASPRPEQKLKHGATPRAGTPRGSAKSAETRPSSAETARQRVFGRRVAHRTGRDQGVGHNIACCDTSRIRIPPFAPNQT